MSKHGTASSEPSCQIEAEQSPLVCFCMKIKRNSLVLAIDDGATDLDQLMAASRAGTGCGTCRIDLIHLLAERGRKDRDD